jgi:DUF438 domain-containing protein
MSELINNSQKRKERLKELILKLHQGDSAEVVRQQLTASLKNIPYDEVVEVEQESSKKVCRERDPGTL